MPDRIRSLDAAIERSHQPAPAESLPSTAEEIAAGVGAWVNHGDPRDEWPGAEDWNLPYLAEILSDAEDEFWTAYHKVCTERGEAAGDAIGTQYEAMARRILTGPELAAHVATARAEALREAAADTIAECLGDQQGQTCDSCKTIAKRLRDRADRESAS